MSSQTGSTPISNFKKSNNKKSVTDDEARLLHTGNPTTEISKLVVDFYQDVLPNYLPCFSFIVQHVVYHCFNGNLCWVIFIAYLINFPYYQ